MNQQQQQGIMNQVGGDQRKLNPQMNINLGQLQQQANQLGAQMQLCTASLGQMGAHQQVQNHQQSDAQSQRSQQSQISQKMNPQSGAFVPSTAPVGQQSQNARKDSQPQNNQKQEISMSKDNFPSLGGNNQVVVKKDSLTDNEEASKKVDVDAKNMLTSEERIVRKPSEPVAAEKQVQEKPQTPQKATPIKAPAPTTKIEPVQEKVAVQEASPIKVVEAPLAEAPVPTEVRAELAPMRSTLTLETPEDNTAEPAEPSPRDEGPTITGVTNLDAEDEEDPDCPASARPTVIRYTKSEILAFMAKDANQNLQERMTSLMRSLIETKNQAIANRRTAANKYGPGAGSYGNKDGNNFAMNKGTGYQRNKPKQGGGWDSNKQKVYNDRGQPEVAQRKVWTDAEKAKIQEIENNMGDFMDKSKNVDEKKKKIQDIKLLLFAITAENFDEILESLKKHCEEYELVEEIITLIIERAWTQQQFTKIYAKLCHDLGKTPFAWCAPDKKGAEFKGMVVANARREFFSGFSRFKSDIERLDENPDIDQTEKFEKYLKGKRKLMGNMAFISELYLLRSLPLKVIKFITYNLVFYSTKHLCTRKSSGSTFPIEEEYIEALIKLFEFSGKKIEARENKDMKKRKQMLMHPDPEVRNSKDLPPDYTNLMNHFVDQLDHAILSNEFDEPMLAAIVDEEKKKELNPVLMSFKFLNNCMKYDISTRIKALIENLNDKKADGWEDTVFNITGPKKLAELEQDLLDKNKKPQTGPRYQEFSDNEDPKDYYNRPSGSNRNHNNNNNNNNEDYELYEKKDHGSGRYGANRQGDQGHGRGGRHGGGGGRHGGDRNYGGDRGYGGGRHGGGRHEEDNNNSGAMRNSSDYFKTDKYNKNFRHQGDRLEKPEEEQKLTRYTSDQTASRGFGHSPRNNKSAQPKVVEEVKFDEAGCKEALKLFLKENRTCETEETYHNYWEETSQDWVSAKDNSVVFKVFLDLYHDCHKSAALGRAKTIPWMYKNVTKSTNKADFIQPLLDFVSNCAMEGLAGDIPHLPMSLATMMASCMTELKFELADFAWKWDEDMDMAEEQKFLYKDVLRELVLVFKTSGNADMKAVAEQAVTDLRTPYE